MVSDIKWKNVCWVLSFVRGKFGRIRVWVKDKGIVENVMFYVFVFLFENIEIYLFLNI